MASGGRVNTTPAARIARPLYDRTPDSTTGHEPTGPLTGHGAPTGHKWMMLICCVPMVAIVVLVIVSGAAGSGTLLWALGCVAMMAAMMFMMPGGHDHR